MPPAVYPPEVAHQGNADSPPYTQSESTAQPPQTPESSPEKAARVAAMKKAAQRGHHRTPSKAGSSGWGTPGRAGSLGAAAEGGGVAQNSSALAAAMAAASMALSPLATRAASVLASPACSTTSSKREPRPTHSSKGASGAAVGSAAESQPCAAEAALDDAYQSASESGDYHRYAASASDFQSRSGCLLFVS